MANRISTILDIDGSGWSSTFKKIRSDMAATDGLFAKMKTGWKGVSTEFKNSGTAQAAVAGGLVVLATQSIKAASSLEESINAVNVSYGDAADSVHKLGEDSAESFGLSQRAFNDFAVQFSAFATQIAQESGRSVSNVVKEMTTRVADFASVMNLDVPEAARIFQSALAGETEPIRKFGIDLSAAAVSAHAVETGMVDSAKEMTEATKVQARYSLLMQSTSKVQGDFANTSDSLANATRIAAANFEDLQASLGKTLIPVVAEAVDTMNQLAASAEKVKGAFDILPGPIQDAVSAMANYPGLMADVMEWQVKFPITAGKTAAGWVGIGDGVAKVTGAVEGSIGALNASTEAIGRAGEEQLRYTDSLEAKADALREDEIAQGRASDAQRDYEDSLLDAAAAGRASAAAREEAAEAAAEAAEIEAAALDKAISKRQEDIDAWQEWRESINSATDSAEGSLADFVENAETSFDEFIENFAKSIVAQAEWKNNLAQIGAETSEEFMAALAEMGTAGAGLVQEIANDSGKMDQAFGLWSESANQAGRDLVGEIDSIKAEAESSARGVGQAISDGMAAGIDSAAANVGNRAAAAARSALDAARNAMRIQSPSQEMADLVGLPMVQGIAQGIIDGTPQAAIDAAEAAGEISEEVAKQMREDLRAVEAGQRMAERVGDAIVDELENQRGAVLDAAEALVDAAASRISDLSSNIGDRFSLEDARESVSDSERAVAEATLKKNKSLASGEAAAIADAQEDLSDAERRLERDNYRLFQQLVKQNGGMSEESWAIGVAAGLTAPEITNLANAIVQKSNAEAKLAAATTADLSADAIGAAVAQALAQFGPATFSAEAVSQLTAAIRAGFSGLGGQMAAGVHG